MMTINRIMIVRTDSIGDVMLTLPMAYFVKQLYPLAEIVFMGKSYTKDIINRCPFIDRFVNADEYHELRDTKSLFAELNLDAVVFALPDKFWMKAAHNAKVKVRIATGHRWYSWMWATHRPMFGRKNSPLHEAQLNLKLLQPLGLPSIPDLERLGELTLLKSTSSVGQNRLIIHPFSQGSALNWTLDEYDALVGMIKDEPWEVVVTGTAKDAETLRQFKGKYLTTVPSVCGHFSLNQFIDYIGESRALLACSTGPLHIAAAMGIKAVGLYVDRRPIHPGRWSPIGAQVYVLKEADEGQNQILITPSEVATFLRTTMGSPTTKP